MNPTAPRGLIRNGKPSLFLVAVAIAVCSASATPISGPIINTANGHTYLLLSENNWTGSESEAVSLGGHLVTINDAAENQWVFDTFSAYGGESRLMWIGLSKTWEWGEFTWSSGDPVTYLNWAPPEPNIKQYEHWVYMYPADAPTDMLRPPGMWNNYRDVSTEFGNNSAGPLRSLFGVVEIPTAAPVADGGVTAILLGSSFAGLMALRRRFIRARSD